MRGPSLDVRILRLKTVPALPELQIYNGRRPIIRYSNETERADLDIYDDFKFEKNIGSPCFIIFLDITELFFSKVIYSRRG